MGKYSPFLKIGLTETMIGTPLRNGVHFEVKEAITPWQQDFSTVEADIIQLENYLKEADTFDRHYEDGIDAACGCKMCQLNSAEHFKRGTELLPELAAAFSSPRQAQSSMEKSLFFMETRAGLPMLQ